jgi:hypothetical protein
VEILAHAAHSKVFGDKDAKVLYLCLCKSIDTLSQEISARSPNFGLLILMDARGVGNEQIWQAPEKLISKGLVYLCAWGARRRESA